MNQNAGMDATHRVGAFRQRTIAATTVALLGILWLLAGSAQAIEKVPAEDMRTTWSGQKSNVALGRMVQNIGDVNGDGRDDFAVTTAGLSSTRSVWVLFGPLRSGPGGSLSDLKPSEGYRIRPSAAVSRVTAAGDQNGDGLVDLFVRFGSNDMNMIFYSVADPAADLPKCDPGGVAETRCLEGSNPETADGQRLGFHLASSSSGLGGVPWSAGDLNGNGKTELVAADSSSDGSVLILANGLGESCDPAPGLCEVDIDSLSAPDLVTISGPGAGIPFPGNPTIPGDVNGDGRDDLLLVSGTDGSAEPRVWVVYGQNWTEDTFSVSDLTDAMGYHVPIPFSFQITEVFAPGDVNGDGVMDIGILNSAFVPSFVNDYVILFGQEGTPNVNVSVNPPAPGTGMKIDWDESLGLNFSGPIVAGLGDLNGDGAGEFAIGSPDATVEGKEYAGVTVLVQSKGTNPPNEISLDANSPASDALILGGTVDSQQFGSSLENAGDLNNDGLADLAIGSPGMGADSFNKNGVFGLITSSNYYSTAMSGLAGSVTHNSAILGGSADSNGRSVDVSFEYGVSTDYGKTTTPESVGKSPRGKSFTAVISGLDADADYHYRAVVVNDLGVKSYGNDRTFKTDAVVPDRCVVDPTLPGCADYDYCADNPAKPGCPDFDYCAANPTVPGCAAVPKAPHLSGLILSQKQIKVKRGKRGVVAVSLVNTGNAVAKGVKICVKAPKRLVKVKACKRVGKLAAGKSATKKFRVKVKRKAKRGKKVVLKFRATAKGLGKKTAKVRVAVR